MLYFENNFVIRKNMFRFLNIFKMKDKVAQLIIILGINGDFIVATMKQGNKNSN